MTLMETFQDYQGNKQDWSLINKISPYSNFESEKHG